MMSNGMTPIEKSIERVSELYREATVDSEVNKDPMSAHHCTAFLTCLQVLNEEKASPWISVKDRLPEIGVAVLTYSHMGGVYKVLRYQGEGDNGPIFRDGYSWGPQVIHWQPLPAPPDLYERSNA